MTPPVLPLSPAELETVVSKLLAYCRENKWAGYDPYDAINSPIFKLPILNRRLPRLVFTQALKRSPVNLRRLMRIPKTQNPKALALNVSALLLLRKRNGDYVDDDIQLMIQRLRDLRSAGMSQWCWGYSFPWQTRTVLIPSGAPNLVCTSFVANALLDAYDEFGASTYLGMAVSAAEYIVEDLYWSEGGLVGFSYPDASSRTQVHNANLLAAALLSRVSRYTGDQKYLVPALPVARYSATKQQLDGSWYYGEAPSQRWIDNFHTGYNLCALQTISRYADTSEFDLYLRRGFDFYRSHFFRDDGAVTYFHDRSHPIDIHCVAQSIITLLTLRELDPSNVSLALRVFRWAVTHMWDDRGFFYYRALRWSTIRIPYMRWSQAWMLLAISKLIDACSSDYPRECGLEIRNGRPEHA